MTRRREGSEVEIEKKWTKLDPTLGLDTFRLNPIARSHVYVLTYLLPKQLLVCIYTAFTRAQAGWSFKLSQFGFSTFLKSHESNAKKACTLSFYKV